MQFQVPQFIEVEDKIFGPLTIRQFIYLAGGAGLCYISYRLLPIFISIFFIGGIGALSVALAFYKYNSRPFIEFVESMFKYGMTSRLYIWKKESRAPTPKETKAAQAANAPQAPKIAVPKLSESKLRDLTWSLDIRENPNPITSKSNQTNT